MLVLTLGRKKQIVVRDEAGQIILRFFMTSDKSQEVRLGIEADKKYAITREPKGEADG